MKMKENTVLLPFIPNNYWHETCKWLYATNI